MVESELRLLQIEFSADPSSPLRAELLHIPLLRAREKGYLALSYTWGEVTEPVTMFLSGASLRIQPNLAKILGDMRALRYGLIWVSPGHQNYDD
jgi:hypothetical protein